MVKKGDIRRYDEWQPDYTPKTHRVTKASLRERDTIRAQKIAEGAVKSDYEKVADTAAFVAIVSMYKAGIDVFQYVMDKLNFVSGVTEPLAEGLGAVWDNATEFFDRIIGKEEVVDEDTGETEIVDVKFETWLSEKETHRIIDKTLARKLKQLKADRIKWIKIRDDLEAAAFTHPKIAERNGILVQIEIKEQQLINLINNKPTEEDCP